MTRTTKTDVREKVEQLNRGWTEPTALSFNCWGTGTNKYQLVDKETGETYGSVCEGASEFMKLLSGFEAGRKT